MVLKRRRAVALAAATLLLVPLANGASYSFVAGAANPADRTFWDLAANWSSGVVPSISDDAALGNFTVNFRTGSHAVNRFTSGIGALLRVTGGTLNYSEASSVYGFSQTSGALSGLADLTITNSASLTGGAQRGIGTTFVGTGSGTYTVGSITFDAGRTLRNVGTLAHNGTSFLDFYVSNTATSRFVNEGTYNIASGGQRSLSSSGGVVTAAMTTNQGTINKTGSGTFSFATLDQAGLLDIAAGTLSLSNLGVLRSGSSTGGAGIFQVNDSNLTVESGATTSAMNLRTDFSARVAYAGNMSTATLLQNSGTIAGSGTFTALSSASLLGGTHSGTGTTLLGSGSGTYTIGPITFDAGRTLRNVGTLAHNGTSFLDFYVSNTATSRFVNEGAYNIASGGQRSLSSSGGVVTAAMTTNQGTINKTGSGTFSFATLDQAGLLDIAAGTLSLSNLGVLRSGSSTGGAGIFQVNDSNLTVESGATTSAMNLRTDFSARVAYAGNMSTATLLQNSGTIAGSGTFTALSSASLLGGTHSGTGTTLLGSGSGTYTIGPITFDAGRTLRNVGTLAHNGTSFLDFYVSNTATSRFVNEGAYNIASGGQRSLSSSGGVVTAAMTTNQGTINKTGSGTFSFATLDQAGLLDIAAGTLSLSNLGVLRSGSSTGGAGIFQVNDSNLTVESGATTSAMNLRTDFSARVAYAGNMSTATLLQNSGTIAGSGTFTALSSASLLGGTHSGTGTTLLGSGSGTYTIGPITFDAGRTLRNVGTLAHNGTSFLDFYVSNTATSRFVNEGTYNIASGGQRSLSSSGGVVTAAMTTNQGTINKTGSGTFSFATLDQAGTLSIVEGSVLVGGPNQFAQGQTIIRTGAVLALVNVIGQQSGGTMTVDGSLNAQFSSARLSMIGGVLTGRGTVADLAYDGAGDYVLVNAGGLLAPGRQDAVGNFTIKGGFAQSGAGVWEIDIASLSSFDTLTVERASLLGGSIRVDALDPELALAVGNRFRIGTFAAGYSGRFDEVVSNDLFAGMRADFLVLYNTDNVEIVVSSLVSEPATLALWCSGILGIAAAARRRGKQCPSHSL